MILVTVLIKITHFRRPLKSSPAVEAIFEDYRKVVPFIVRDEVMYPHIANSIEFLRK